MSSLQHSLDAKAKFESDFAEQKEQILANIPDSVRDLKLKAFEDFKRLGFPHIKMEDWRFTDIAPKMETTFKHDFKPINVEVEMQDVFKCDVPNIETRAITLLNGKFPIEGDSFTTYPDGVIAGSLKQAFTKFPELTLAHYAKYDNHENDGLSAVNTVFATDGLFLYIPKNVVAEKPIQIINIVNSLDDLMIETRNLIIVEESAEAQIIMCDHSLYFNKSFTNSVSEVSVGNNAKFEFYRMQNSSNNTSSYTSVYVNQERDSRFISNVITLHGGFVRNNIHVKLNGEGGEANLHGLYLTDRNQHIDNHTIIEHIAPNCTSNEHYKGILDDEATGVFSGRVKVHRDAQKTQAFQSNNNILLTDTAKINTKPQLEIYADDVKCSHGATIGQLDPDAMFYLIQRGINPQEARMLLLNAFASAIINQINVPALRDRMDDLITKRLRGELSRCNNCAIKCG